MPDSFENKLKKLYRKYKEGDSQAKEDIIILNLPLVQAITRRFTGEGVDHDDLFQEGCLGLLKAVHNFDPERGTRFSTYAVPFILGSIRAFLRRSGHLLKVSRSCYERYRLLRQCAEELVQELGRMPNLEEIAQKAAIPVEEAAWLLELSRPVSPLEEEQLPSLSLPGKESDPSLEKTLDGIVLEEKMGKLPLRERQLIVLRFFLQKSQEEVARLLGLSQSYVSRLEKEILRKLKKE